MKNLILIKNFYSKNIFFTIFVLVVMVLSNYNIMLFLGNLNYTTYTKDFFVSSNFENGFYYMPRSQGNKDLNEQLKSQFEKNEISGVKAIIRDKISNATYGSSYVNILFCNKEYIDAINPVDSGSWLGESSNDNDVVLCGYIFDNVNLNDEIEINLLTGENESVKLNVIGKKTEPYFYPMFSSGGDFVSTDLLFDESSNYILISDNDFINEYFSVFSYSTNAYITMEDSASSEDIDKLCAYLSRRDTYLTYDEIIDNTNNNIKIIIKDTIPVPLFLTVIGAVSFVILSILLIRKKLSEQLIYMFCGCSKRKSFVYLMSALSIIGIVAFAISVVAILITTQDTEKFYKFVINNSTIAFTGIYTFVCILISGIMPYRMIKKNTVHNLYGRVK